MILKRVKKGHRKKRFNELVINGLSVFLLSKEENIEKQQINYV